jgi:hypothetical protein
LSEHIKRYEYLQGLVVFAEKAIREQDEKEETPWASSRNREAINSDYEGKRHRKRKRIGPDMRLPKAVVDKRKLEGWIGPML